MFLCYFFVNTTKREYSRARAEIRSSIEIFLFLYFLSCSCIIVVILRLSMCTCDDNNCPKSATNMCIYFLLNLCVALKQIYLFMLLTCILK